jgi:predicted ABC-type transport system involved in lysophospholipase L1 biosynthesis ATPase subunit
MDLLLSLSGDGGRTVIVVTHDTEVAERAERVLRMHDGRFSTLPEVVAAAGRGFESS